MGWLARHQTGALKMKAGFAALMLAIFISPALAGPPYVTDDPEPTDEGRYEIYAFTGGSKTADGIGGQAGIDFNYGGAKDLQLTAVVPLAFESSTGGLVLFGLGDIELAAKYKFLHEEGFGFNVAIFPRLFLPTSSDPALGNRHASLFIPLFAQKDWGEWSLFGGGGCTLNRGGSAQNFCQEGVVVTRRITSSLQIGAELYHQAPDQRGGRQSSGLGFGAIYDIDEHHHLLASAGPGIQNAATTNQATWYVAMLFTY